MSIFNQIIKKFFFTLFILMLYRLGTYVPFPLSAESGFFLKVLDYNFFSNTKSSIFNSFSGGALSRMAIFSLGIFPYIVASISSQLIKTGFFGDEDGDISIDNMTKIIAIIVAIVQGIFVTVDFYNKTGISFSLFITFINVISMVTSVFILIWIGNLITKYGIGNGVSVIIFTSIVSEIPNNFINTNAAGSMLYSVALNTTTIMAFIALVVLFETSFRKVGVFYPNNRSFAKKYNDSNYIPIKINVSGVMPPIFANSVLVLVSSFSNYFKVNFAPGSLFYNAIYSILIVFFCFFYSGVSFDTASIADNIKKSSGIISGIRPGANTNAYLRSIVNKLNFLGSAYMLFICLFFDFFNRHIASLPISVTGTSILIIVGIIIEVTYSIQNNLLLNKYKKIKKII